MGNGARNVKRCRFKFNDKMAALNAIARIQGYFDKDMIHIGDGQSLVERIQAGRNRLALEATPVEDTEEVEFEEVEDGL